METVITADQLTMREVIADPYPAYRQLREQSPFKYIFVPAESRPGLKEPIRAWAFMKHDDVYGALRDHETFSSVRPAKWAQMFPRLVLIEDDPPRHTRFRRLVNKAFTVRRIEELTPWITAVANELIDRLGAGENDIVPAYAIPLPVRVIARLLGIPGEDYETFKRWSDAFLSTVPTEQAENRLPSISRTKQTKAGRQKDFSI